MSDLSSVATQAVDITSAPRVSIGQQIKADRAMLVERFPLCFCDRGEAKRPLALGIGPDIARHHLMPRRRLKMALHDYTHGRKYLQALQEGAARTALDGSVAGTVSPEHARHAAEVLARRTAASRHSKPKAAQLKSRKNRA